MIWCIPLTMEWKWRTFDMTDISFSCRLRPNQIISNFSFERFLEIFDLLTAYTMMCYFWITYTRIHFITLIVVEWYHHRVYSWLNVNPVINISRIEIQQKKRGNDNITNYRRAVGLSNTFLKSIVCSCFLSI